MDSLDIELAEVRDACGALNIAAATYNERFSSRVISREFFDISC
ncbi:MAG: hypothetical protein ABII27_04615 [bacterium]